jgi:hypothetical protein
LLVALNKTCFQYKKRFAFSFWTSYPLKMGPIRSPETSAKDYHLTLRNIPEEGRSQVFWVSHYSANAVYQQDFEIASRATNINLQHRTFHRHLLLTQTFLHPSRSTKLIPQYVSLPRDNISIMKACFLISVILQKSCSQCGPITSSTSTALRNVAVE